MYEYGQVTALLGRHLGRVLKVQNVPDITAETAGATEATDTKRWPFPVRAGPDAARGSD